MCMGPTCDKDEMTEKFEHLSVWSVATEEEQLSIFSCNLAAHTKSLQPLRLITDYYIYTLQHQTIVHAPSQLKSMAKILVSDDSPFIFPVKSEVEIVN